MLFSFSIFSNLPYFRKRLQIVKLNPPFLTNELHLVRDQIQEFFGISFIVVTPPKFVQTKK
ncbi:hypothetical protein DIC78_17200 [Bacillus halotolerans]|uniref:Uncharacterized protein n=1 Tax=Bacillus halotolerans TaxID=260554 RepID=A0A9Q6F2T9_9BACI|nr:hypothetical protein DIC78_17200 [Bacillus halotolerans]PAY12229.1 hypothetical protein CJU60_15535 [Bacillus sp. 7705b]PLS08850.1 hypothetical protein CUU63_06340 [Bacillus halotolerans]PRS21091.1 hypothetical protein C6W25_11115 [Bacillus halotolerans]